MSGRRWFFVVHSKVALGGRGGGGICGDGSGVNPGWSKPNNGGGLPDLEFGFVVWRSLGTRVDPP